MIMLSMIERLEKWRTNVERLKWRQKFAAHAALLLALLVCLSCPSKTSTDKKTSTGIENCLADQISEITLEREGSFGLHPSYKVVLRSDETVLYIGRAFVDKQGEHTGKLDKFYFYKLSKLIESERYFKMRERYPEGPTIMDGYDAWVKVKCGDKAKVEFDNAQEGPIELWAIEMAIDAAVGSARWEIVK